MATYNLPSATIDVIGFIYTSSGGIPQAGDIIVYPDGCRYRYRSAEDVAKREAEWGTNIATEENTYWELLQ